MVLYKKVCPVFSLPFCQNKNEEQVSTTAETETVTTAEETATAPDQGTIEVSLNDEDTMKFDTSEFKVPAGKLIRITLHHV